MEEEVELAEEGLIDDTLEKINLPPEKKMVSRLADAAVAQEDLQEIMPSDKKPQPDGTESATLEGMVDMGRFEVMTPPKSEKEFENSISAQTVQEKKTVISQTDDSENQEKNIPDYPLTVETQTGIKTIEPLQTESLQVIANLPTLEPVRVLEAALFLANKPLSFKQLMDILQTPRERINVLLRELGQWMPKESAMQLMVNEHGAAIQLKPEYVERVAKLSKEVELSRKAMKILALVAKKKQFLQSELKQYFRGEIYAYVTELKRAGYIESKKHGNTRLLKPTSKFYESFQLKE